MSLAALLLAAVLPCSAADQPALLEVQARLSAALSAEKASRAEAAKTFRPGRRAFLSREPRCILEGVLAIMGLEARAEEALPPVSFESATPLKRFQDALEKQWGGRPARFSNAYAAARNEIFLIDDAAYYARLKRSIDDSLAHELTHFIQVRYKKIPIEQFDESMEAEAVSVQTEYRERFVKTDASPCPAR